MCVHRPSGRLTDRQQLKTAGAMLFQAVPLMLVLFFLFPRIPPLWAVPLKA
ncbi:MAG: transglutaminaseTgpA domain-containing protein, partial [Pseudomonadota bacterium]